ncbi:hypothetical protein SCHPADRAFT_432956 [Schizopora paradoxa]|uniref:Uncharacterized protein n=1 Tax=Schizopora paradoxa TaxID=27342 RepID=A0A0H2RK27_9AGAM|nr:hypothetical protein SCHPADRAFT_432956 [Schizopora paradoxa]
MLLYSARAPIYFSLSLSILSLFLEVFTISLIVKNIQKFRKLLPIGWTQVLRRILVFSLYRIVLLCLMIASPLVASPVEFFLMGFSKNNLYNGIIDFMQASVPLVIFLIFASEKDILQAWCFWRRKSNLEPIVKHENNASQVTLMITEDVCSETKSESMIECIISKEVPYVHVE